jgi:regulator of cell morphogenesis and NO signaling
MDVSPRTIVRDLVLERPNAMRVLAGFHIDFCCGGNRSLDDACRLAEVPVDQVLNALVEARRREAEPDTRDWRDVPTDELIDYIVDVHHAYTREEIARVSPLMAKVKRRHGPAHPELVEVDELFSAVVREVEPHLLREERILFPWIRRLDAWLAAGQGVPPAPFGDVERPIAVMEDDHETLGELLREMRHVTADFHLPDGACNSYRALYQGLEALEQDLHRHVHLEHNLLFPRVRAQVAQARSQVA